MPGHSRQDDERARLMERLRREIALELGIPSVDTANWGALPTALCGKLGAMVRQRADALLKNRHVPKN